ncbi:PEP-CTERM sorting domain-containing protein [Stieleria sp. JC731]
MQRGRLTIVAFEGSGSPPPPTVPEPSSFAIFGLIGLAGCVVRRRSKN